MSSMHRIVQVAGMWLYVFLSVHGKVCPPDGDSSADYFPLTDNIRVLYVRYGHYAYLPCCGDHVDWYKWDNSTSLWQSYRPYNDGNMSPSFEENTQILTFKSTEYRDEGKYKCVIQRDNADLLENIFSLQITACDELERGPYPIAPLPCERTYTDLRATLTLPCTGYFGCGGDEMRSVTWYIREETDKKWTPAAHYNSRYREVTFARNNGELGANLTISDVQTDDFATEFMCLLSTPQMVKGQTEIHVRLVNNGMKNNLQGIDVAFASLNVAVYISLAVFVTLLLVVLILTTIVNLLRTRNSKKVPALGKESQCLTSAGNEVFDV